LIKSDLNPLEILSRIRGNTSEEGITDLDALDNNLLASFWVLGRKHKSKVTMGGGILLFILSFPY